MGASATWTRRWGRCFGPRWFNPIVSTALVQFDYAYDANGNRTNTGYSTGAGNQLLSDGTYRYLYDNEGNRTFRFVDADSSGTLSTNDTNITKYEWDYRNRLTAVTHFVDFVALSGNSSDQTAEYAYDYLDRRILKKLDSNGSVAGGVDYFYNAYQGDNAALEINDQNGLAATGTGENAPHRQHRYLYGAAVDETLASEDTSAPGATTGTVLWGLSDHEGTIRDIVNNSHTVVDHRKYDAFGKMTSESAPTTDFIFGYTGQALDKSTNLYDYGHRWYDSAVGRFATEDPSGFSAGDMNLYRYVGNNPLNNTDPTGLCGNGLAYNSNYTMTNSISSYLGSSYGGSSLGGSGGFNSWNSTTGLYSSGFGGSSIYSGITTTGSSYMPNVSSSAGSGSIVSNPFGNVRTGNTSVASALASTPNVASLFSSAQSSPAASQARTVTDAHDALMSGLITQQGAFAANSLGSAQLQQALNGPWGQEQNRLVQQQQGVTGTLNGIQAGLDAVGTFEPTPFADLTNTAISMLRGNWSDAGLTALGVIPFIGDAGKVVKDVGKLEKAAIHGNSALSPRTAHLYELYGESGEFLKWGVTQDMNKRYTKSFMADKKMYEAASGSRADMLRMERTLVETNPGSLNREPWRGARKAGQ